MRAALFALVLLLPLMVWWQSRRGEAAAGLRSTGVRVDPANAVLLLASTAAIGGSIAAALYHHWPAFVEDAYISFRYAQNLAWGHGLSWNPGEAPLEGFTNLLLVLLMAPVIRLGMDPLLLTRALSLLSVGGVCLLLHHIAVRELEWPRPVALLAALAYPVASNALPVALIGLESSLYTFVVFAAFTLVLAHERRREPRLLAGAGALAFVAFLLRPDAVALVLATVLAYLALGRLRELPQRRALVAMVLAFALPLAVYLLWKWLYFGTVVPNPARIKMVGDGAYLRSLGFGSVIGYFLEHAKLLFLALVAFSLWPRAGLGRLIAALMVAIPALFYAGVDTLMDMHHRFLHPVTPFLYFLALPTLGTVIGHLLRWRESVMLKLPVVAIVLSALLFQFSEGPVGYLRLVLQSEREDPGVEGVLAQVGEVIADFGESDALTIMSQDAGLVPYLTRARHLDTAGLNDRVIARGGDPMALAGYLFDQEPTLVIHRGRKDGALLSYAHGPLGDQRSWAGHPGWDAYRHLGSIDQSEIHDLHFFVRRGDARAEELAELLQRELITQGPEERPLVLGSRRGRSAASDSDAAQDPSR